jgi:hypothetical protein
VVSVGPAADAALAAATDDSPIYVSGWRIGTDRHGCPGFDLGSPAPNGVMWKECSALALRATVDGGATLPVYLNYANLDVNLRGPEGTMAMEVLLRVHTHDAGCAADDCLHKPVYDAVVQYRVPRLAPAVLAASMPPGGVTMAEAIATADAYVANNPSSYSASWVLLRAELGSRIVVGENGGEPDGDWAWAIWYVSTDGYFETTVYVDFRSGTANHSSGGSLEFP